MVCFCVKVSWRSAWQAYRNQSTSSIKWKQTDDQKEASLILISPMLKSSSSPERRVECVLLCFHFFKLPYQSSIASPLDLCGSMKHSCVCSPEESNGSGEGAPTFSLRRVEDVIAESLLTPLRPFSFHPNAIDMHQLLSVAETHETGIQANRKRGESNALETSITLCTGYLKTFNSPEHKAEGRYFRKICSSVNETRELFSSFNSSIFMQPAERMLRM